MRRDKYNEENKFKARETSENNSPAHPSIFYHSVKLRPAWPCGCSCTFWRYRTVQQITWILKSTEVFVFYREKMRSSQTHPKVQQWHIPNRQSQKVWAVRWLHLLTDEGQKVKAQCIKKLLLMQMHTWRQQFCLIVNRSSAAFSSPWGSFSLHLLI